MADPLGLKKSLAKRMGAVEGETASEEVAAPKPTMSQSQFGKPFTAAEKAAQAAKLADALRKRGE